MKTNEQSPELIEAREKAKSFVESTRWLNIGPAQGWNKGERQYLLCLGSFPNITVTPSLLGKVFGEQQSSVSERLKRLEEKGFIKTETSEDDKREKHIRLTDEGNRQYTATCLFLYGNTKYNPIDLDNY